MFIFIALGEFGVGLSVAGVRVIGEVYLLQQCVQSKVSGWKSSFCRLVLNAKFPFSKNVVEKKSALILTHSWRKMVSWALQEHQHEVNKSESTRI